jgi:hypothetical protein
MCEPRKRAAGRTVLAIEPQVRLENLPIPVGAVRCDHNRIAVGRDLDAAEFDVIEKFVERDFRFIGRGGEASEREQESSKQNA